MAKVTVREIAKIAGVSIGTVSRALKSQPGLSEATRAHILKIAHELAYDFERLRETRLKRLTFILHRSHNNLFSSPFYSQVLNGAEAQCRDEGMTLSYLAIGPGDVVDQMLAAHAPDALLCAGFMDADLIALLKASGKPLVLVDHVSPGLPSVTVENFEGAVAAVAHLVAMGRKRIAFLSGSLTHHSIRQRERGYRQALFDAGRLADPALEVSLPLDQAFNTKNTIAAMNRLLDLPEPPDAIFACNDATALAAMRACDLRGVRIPEDIAFIGFDDISQAADAVPPLSTVAIDKEALGRAGVRLLFEDPALVQSHTLPVELIVRASSAGGQI